MHLRSKIRSIQAPYSLALHVRKSLKGIETLKKRNKNLRKANKILKTANKDLKKVNKNLEKIHADLKKEVIEPKHPNGKSVTKYLLTPANEQDQPAASQEPGEAARLDHLNGYSAGMQHPSGAQREIPANGKIRPAAPQEAKKAKKTKTESGKSAPPPSTTATRIPRKYKQIIADLIDAYKAGEELIVKH